MAEMHSITSVPELPCCNVPNAFQCAPDGLPCMVMDNNRCREPVVTLASGIRHGASSLASLGLEGCHAELIWNIHIAQLHRQWMNPTADSSAAHPCETRLLASCMKVGLCVQSGTWKRYSAVEPVEGLLQQIRRDLSLGADIEFTRIATRPGTR